MVTLDCATLSTRAINAQLASLAAGESVCLLNPAGRHNLALGLQQTITVEVMGHCGYYYGGMNEKATIEIHGNAGPGVGENMMSGTIHVHGYASSAAGASAHGGLLVIEKGAGLRCGISLKGGTIAVGGNVGNFSAFMAQAGTLLICGDAGEALGDSLYEAVIYLRGTYKSLGADAREEPMTDTDRETVAVLLERVGFAQRARPDDFKRIASARTLYNFDVNQQQRY